MATTSGPCVRPYGPPDRRSVVELWSACGLLRPWNDPDRDIERKVSHDGEGLLVLEVDGRIVGSEVNLQVRAANGEVLDFYRRLGYVPDEVVSMGKRLVDEAGAIPVPHRPVTPKRPGDRPPVEAAHAP